MSSEMTLEQGVLSITRKPAYLNFLITSWEQQCPTNVHEKEK
jgi:hypothetical protein